MKKLSFLPVLAFLLAIGASAFTQIDKANSDLVWFKLDPDTGLAIDPTDGQRSVSDPYSCDQGQAPCSVALSLEDGEIEEIGGTYRIAQGVDYTDPQIYESMHFEQTR